MILNSRVSSHCNEFFQIPLNFFSTFPTNISRSTQRKTKIPLHRIGSESFQRMSPNACQFYRKTIKTESFHKHVPSIFQVCTQIFHLLYSGRKQTCRLNWIAFSALEGFLNYVDSSELSRFACKPREQKNPSVISASDNRGLSLDRDFHNFFNSNIPRLKTLKRH